MRHYAELEEQEIPTLGIVAVNIEQRDLLQEEIRRITADDALVEEYREKVASKGEPLFIKNLENVQGDERDFILISLTYGREPGATAMKQRFGPINGRQGHRRLNVLFTRARVRIGLFASFGSADVIPTETSSEGVLVLKGYLEYAEGRGRAPVLGIGGEADSDFEVEVADRLRSRGYEVELQVGVSGFRIDIGVRHPNHPERFLAGVECDGARYHSSKSARDRDRLREEVLNDLGWEIVRVWSTDWFSNPASATEKLVRSLERIRTKPPKELESYPPFADPRRSGESTEEEVQRDASGGSENTRLYGTGVASESTSPGHDEFGAEPVEDKTNDAVGHLTKGQVIQALVSFRDDVIRKEIPDWEMHRSILRDAMIETFVTQHFTDVDEWFAKVPAFLRQATNPMEKNKYLERICEIVSRIDSTADPRPVSDYGVFKLTSPEGRPKPSQRQLPLGFRPTHSPTDDRTVPAIQYTGTDFSLSDLRPEPNRFYDDDYRSNLRKMITLVVDTEAPIFEDVLVERVARAHGFQRSGNNIYQVIRSLMTRDYARSQESDRVVVWPKGAKTDRPWPYRESSQAIRSHGDIPIAELAGLAEPFVRLGMGDEDVLRRMAEHFRLERLREATRKRFEEALNLARSSLQ
jgi:very-short-patch-repair endonuclease